MATNFTANPGGIAPLGPDMKNLLTDHMMRAAEALKGRHERCWILTHEWLDTHNGQILAHSISFWSAAATAPYDANPPSACRTGPPIRDSPGGDEYRQLGIWTQRFWHSCRMKFSRCCRPVRDGNHDRAVHGYRPTAMEATLPLQTM